MKQLPSFFVGIACLSLIGLYPKCVQGEGVELGPSIGIGFAFGPININLLELSIPLSWFTGRQWGRSTSRQRAIYSKFVSYPKTSSFPPTPAQPVVEPFVVHVDPSSAMSKEILQLLFGLLEDEDVVTAANGQRLQIEKDGQILIVDSSPSVRMTIQYDDRIIVRLNRSVRAVAEISYTEGNLVIRYDSNLETRKALNLIFGSSFASCCLNP